MAAALGRIRSPRARSRAILSPAQTDDAREAVGLTRLFASDLDGTLLNALHEVDGTILRALDRVLASGRHVALATGRCVRTPSELGFGARRLDVVCSNGSLIIGSDGSLLRSVSFDRAALEELLASFPTLCFNCVALDGTYVRGSREQHKAGLIASRGLVGALATRRMRRSLVTPSVRFDQADADVLRHDICKVNCRSADLGLKRELAAFVAEHDDTIVNASFDGDLFELTHASVNKGEAVAWLATRLGIGEDEVAVYGDGGNDLAMLERFSHAYAPRNASAAAKEAAGHVIGSCTFHAVPRHMWATARREGALG